MLLVYAIVKDEKGPLKRTEQRQLLLTRHSKSSLTFLNGEWREREESGETEIHIGLEICFLLQKIWFYKKNPKKTNDKKKN